MRPPLTLLRKETPVPSPIVLSTQQAAAVSWLMDQICDGVPLVALRGLAGTGKTSLIPALRQGLEDMGIPVTLGAPTHRAAMVLKRKGQADAQTMHSAALTSYFTPDYARAVQWLGESVPVKLDTKLPMPDVQGLPWLIHDKLHGQTTKAQTVQRRAVQYGAKKALASIGINGKEHFAGFGPKMGTGCLIIDEASMVGRDMLGLCMQAFPLVCLIGDPGQLPPVKDGSCLADVEGFDLTEIHRQAADSPIIQLAYAARQGQRFWERLPSVAGQLEAWRSIDAEAFLESPLLVWRNTTRLECTRMIRQELGYPAEGLHVGEPLVCRSTDPADRSEGLYNNALFRVVEVLEGGRAATIQEDCGDKTHSVYVHMEEVHGSNIDPQAVPFRFGYCLTAHTAQGGEWPTVYISQPDLYAKAGSKNAEDFPCWAYTAITRAKQTLGFLTKHDFTRQLQIAVPAWKQGETMPLMTPTPTPTPDPMTPPSAPLMNNGMPQPSSAPQVASNEPDDIPDPVVPPDVLAVLAQAQQMAQPEAGGPQDATWRAHEALLSGFCQALQGQMARLLTDEAIRLSKQFDETITRVMDYVKGRLEGNEHAEYSLAAALAQVQDKGLTLSQATATPYTAVVEARTPHGFPLRLTIEKGTSGELIEELGRLEGWLVTNGYTVVEGVGACSRSHP